MNEQQQKAEDLVWLRSIAGELATATLRSLDENLAWYREMPPEYRSAIGLVAQSGITSFINWYEDSSIDTWQAADVFSAGPKELMRSVSLQQTLQLVQVVVNVVHERLVSGSTQVRTAFLAYSRDVAFAAANVYAKAAEARGLWDARLEALVVDSVLSGEFDEELPSRISAVGWLSRGHVSVVVGPAPNHVDSEAIRKVCDSASLDSLIGVQGRRLVVILGINDSQDDGPSVTNQQALETFCKLARSIAKHFAKGPIVIGPPATSLLEANRSAKAALAGFTVAAARPELSSPMLADELLPERALAGDAIAKQTLRDNYFEPIATQSADLLLTLRTYLDAGRSLEGTARALFVHPNTVRYRLKRIGEILHIDPTSPRSGFVLQAALVLGAISRRNIQQRR